MTVNNNCESCDYFKKTKFSAGECRKRAPMRMLIVSTYPGSYDEERQTTWPIVDFSDWCGDFRCRIENDRQN